MAISRRRMDARHCLEGDEYVPQEGDLRMCLQQDLHEDLLQWPARTTALLETCQRLQMPSMHMKVSHQILNFEKLRHRKASNKSLPKHGVPSY